MPIFTVRFLPFIIDLKAFKYILNMSPWLATHMTNTFSLWLTWHFLHIFFEEHTFLVFMKSGSSVSFFMVVPFVS